MRKRLLLCAAMMVGASCSTGCQYYRLDNLETGESYYTRQWVWKRDWPAGETPTRFKDLLTGKTVELDSLESFEIEPTTYEKATLAVGYH